MGKLIASVVRFISQRCEFLKDNRSNAAQRIIREAKRMKRRLMERLPR